MERSSVERHEEHVDLGLRKSKKSLKMMPSKGSMSVKRNSTRYAKDQSKLMVEGKQKTISNPGE